MLIKVVVVQARMGCRLSLPDMIHIFKQRPDFVCLPEYWLLDETVGDFHRAALRFHEYLEYLSRLSEELATCVIAGTVVAAENESLYNTCPVILRGSVLGLYRKRHPVQGEGAKGIRPGSENLVIDVGGTRVGVMICGDVFHEELYDEMRREGADIVFVPTTSPYRPDDTIAAKKQRDQKYFIDGSRRAGAYVAKTCGVGKLFERPLQGRSLVVAPWGVLSRVGYDDEENQRIMTVTLDIGDIRDFRTKLVHLPVSPERRPSD